MRGLPGSGKSTHAKKLSMNKGGGYGALKVRRVNRDDVRRMLGVYDDFTPKRERIVSATMKRAVEAILRAGDSVVVDDCNLNPTYIDEWKQIAAEYEQIHHEKVEVEIVDFTNVPLRECLKRNQQRQADERVAVKIIHEMYERWIKPGRLLPHPDLPHCIIVDMDGTLVHIGDRSPFDASRCDVLDTPNEPVINLVRASVLSALHTTRVIIMSGRENKDREPTVRWLRKYGVDFHRLFMRSTGDHRNDAIVKQELYEQEIAGKYNVDFCVDDRDRVVDLWRSLGLTCFQVAEGWF